MGMVLCETEGRGSGAKDHPRPHDKKKVAPIDYGEIERRKRLRSNSEETALILTSMSKGSFAAGENGKGTGKDKDPVTGKTKRAASRGLSEFLTRNRDQLRRQHEQEDHVDRIDEEEEEDEDDEDAAEENPDEEDQMSESNATGSKRVNTVQQINFAGPKGSKLDFTDEAGFSHRFRNESNRVKSLVTKHISIEELRAHFDRPIIEVAKDFGICITLMKKICRRNGIKRWPHRQIRSLSKSIASMEAAMLSAHGAEREKYRDQIENLKLKRESVIADPNKENNVRSSSSSSASPAPASGSTATIPNELELSSGMPRFSMTAVKMNAMDGASGPLQVPGMNVPTNVDATSFVFNASNPSEAPVTNPNAEAMTSSTVLASAPMTTTSAPALSTLPPVSSSIGAYSHSFISSGSAAATPLALAPQAPLVPTSVPSTSVTPTGSASASAPATTTASSTATSVSSLASSSTLKGGVTPIAPNFCPNGVGAGAEPVFSKGGRWTAEEHAAFLEGIRLYGKDWRRVSKVVGTRSAVQTRTHAQKYLLKFAGKFPFDADGMLKQPGVVDEHQNARAQYPQHQQHSLQAPPSRAGMMGMSNGMNPHAMPTTGYVPGSVQSRAIDGMTAAVFQQPVFAPQFSAAQVAALQIQGAAMPNKPDMSAAVPESVSASANLVDTTVPDSGSGIVDATDSRIEEKPPSTVSAAPEDADSTVKVESAENAAIADDGAVSANADVENAENAGSADDPDKASATAKSEDIQNAEEAEAAKVTEDASEETS